MELIRAFSAQQYRRALESWGWAAIGARIPVFASPFGDVFFRAPDGFWWLDLLEGQLTRPWENAEVMKAELDTTAGQDRFLLAGLAWSAQQHGIIPGPDQVLGFKVAPIIGGRINVESIEAIDFVVSVNLAGQLHGQLRSPALRHPGERRRGRPRRPGLTGRPRRPGLTRSGHGPAGCPASSSARW